MRFSRPLAVTLLAAGVSAAVAAVPEVTPQVKSASETIFNDPAIQAIYKELSSEANAKERFNTHMELARIASPSRSEFRRADEIARRLVEEWGFAAGDIMTRKDGILKGAGIQKVDGFPVHNVCVRIPGTYSSQKGAVSYKGQFPKVLLEGHTDSVNPPVLPPASNPYVPVKLQKITDPLVASPQQLASLKDELHFDKNGKIIEDAEYKKAYQRFDNAEAAKKGGAYRIYVPGFADAMGNTTSVMQIAKQLKKHNVKPVYDFWICGTTGEEGQGNLSGMKQLYGYNQDTGKGNNALNFVANLSIDSTQPKDITVNYLGSYRFEIKYTEPDCKGGKHPSAAMAMSRSIAKIAQQKTAWDTDKSAEKTTYTVGVAKCDKAQPGQHSKSCTLMVDMRSLSLEPLNEIRSRIEPTFKAAMEEENAKYGVKSGSKDAVSMELVWFGDRPAYKRTNYNDPVMQAYWQASETVNIDVREDVQEDPASLNDNVPAAVGVPTINFNVHTPAVNGGGHAYWEWGVPGNYKDEAKRMVRAIVTGLTLTGYHTADGKVVEPAIGPMGKRTTEDMY